ncbi:MAG: hypothetical protein R2867_42765 [Caldilineaceae bacterium]
MQHGTQVGKEKEQQWWIFDGLRGANEVAAAATALPKAHFVVLDAPDLIRVQRLLGRSDAFDRIAIQNSPQQPDAKAHSLSAIGIPEAEPLFTASEVHTLLALCAAPIGGGDLRSTNCGPSSKS